MMATVQGGLPFAILNQAAPAARPPWQRRCNPPEQLRAALRSRRLAFLQRFPLRLLIMAIQLAVVSMAPMALAYARSSLTHAAPPRGYPEGLRPERRRAGDCGRDARKAPTAARQQTIAKARELGAKPTSTRNLRTNPSSKHEAIRGPLTAKVIQVTSTTLYLNRGARDGLSPGTPAVLYTPDGTPLPLTLSKVCSGGSSASWPAEVHRIPQAGWRVSILPRQQATPQTPAAPHAQSPVVLPSPDPSAVLAKRWLGVSTQRTNLLTAKRSTSSNPIAAAPPPIHGALRLEYLSLLDLAAAPQANYHRLGISSELAVPQLLLSGLDYRHQLRLRWDVARDLSARPFQDGRPHLMIYQLQFGWSLADRLRAEAGRIGASPLPMGSWVDGGSVRTRLAPGLYLGAFGGLAPRLLDLGISSHATRFGAYASLRLGQNDVRRQMWSLAADVGFIGSTWQGTLDRKALSSQLRLAWNTRLALYSQATVDFFGDQHPAQPGRADVTNVDVDIDLRALTWLRFGLRYNRYRFIPSLESLRSLGEAYVTQQPIQTLQGHVSVTPCRCLGIDLDGGWQAQPRDLSAAWAELAFRFQHLLAQDRLSLAGNMRHGDFLVGYGARLSYDLQWLDGLGSYLSLALYHDRYQSEAAAQWRYSALAGLDASISRHWTASGAVETLLDANFRTLHVLGTLAYRF